MKNMQPLPECPFYLEEHRRGVRCEGLTEDSTVRLCFPEENAFKDYRDSYCYCMNWEKCLIARMLHSKHGC